MSGSTAVLTRLTSIVFFGLGGPSTDMLNAFNPTVIYGAAVMASMVFVARLNGLGAFRRNEVKGSAETM